MLFAPYNIISGVEIFRRNIWSNYFINGIRSRKPQKCTTGSSSQFNPDYILRNQDMKVWIHHGGYCLLGYDAVWSGRGSYWFHLEDRIPFEGLFLFVTYVITLDTKL
jgi:hypothetical protein